MELFDLLARAANVDHVFDPLPPEIAAQDKGPAIVATVCSLVSVTTLFVAARLYTRARVLGALHLDDWLIIISLIFTWIATGFSVAANEHGAGRHVRALTQRELHDAIFFTMTGFVPSLMSFGVPKLAVVALLTRLMNPSRFHRIFLWALAGSCFAALGLTLIIEFSQCDPVSALWDKSIMPEEKRCWDPRVNIYFAYFSGAYSAFVDMYLAIYPTCVLFKLQMAWKKKLALSSALSLGGVAAVVAIYKCTRLPSLGSPDYTYDTADLVIWTSIESNTLIIATCIPILQPLIDRLFGRRLLSNARTDGHGGYGYGYGNGYGAYSSEPKTSQTGVHAEVELADSRSPGSPRKPAAAAAARASSVRRKRDLESSMTDPDECVATVTAAGGSDSQESILGLEGALRMKEASASTSASVISAPTSPFPRGPPPPKTIATLPYLGRKGKGGRRKGFSGHHQYHSHASPTKGGRALTITSGGGGGGMGAAGSTAAPAPRMTMVSAGVVAGLEGGGLAFISPPARGIVRTDIVTVSYDKREKGSEDSADGARSHPGFWRPRHF